MLLHVVALDLSHLADTDRATLETSLATLGGMPDVKGFRLGWDEERPHVTAFAVVLPDATALAAYREHQVHLAVAQAIRDSGARVTRVDLDWPDPPDTLALRADSTAPR
ncbi:MAG: hypothetical protein QOK05_2023 [Chloroflexota bacterium]|jgi:hypothetical protein|nr:hypothetical protein [Chloroflexota bacterium]